MEPENFLGPNVLLIGPDTDEAIRYAGGLMLRYSKNYDEADARITLSHRDGNSSVRSFCAGDKIDSATPLTMVD